MPTTNTLDTTAELLASDSSLPPVMPYKTAIPKPRLTPEERAHLKRPKVLIVGAGIGGLTLGILLQKGGIDYQIFERAKEVKPLGKETVVVQ